MAPEINLDRLMPMIRLRVAGNFAGHLEQAGEAHDFLGVVVKEENC